jgi:D-lactate dehydrogenase
LREDSLHLAKGADYVSVLTEAVDAKLLSGLKDMGVKMLGTRTVGYDHIDCAHAVKIPTHLILWASM